MVEGLHPDDVAELAERPREGLREVPVAPARRDLLVRGRDRDRDAERSGRQRARGAEQLRAVRVDVAAPGHRVGRDRLVERAARAHRTVVDDDRARDRDDPAAPRPQLPHELEARDVGIGRFGHAAHRLERAAVDEQARWPTRPRSSRAGPPPPAGRRPHPERGRIGASSATSTTSPTARTRPSCGVAPRRAAQRVHRGRRRPRRPSSRRPPPRGAPAMPARARSWSPA